MARHFAKNSRLQPGLPTPLAAERFLGNVDRDHVAGRKTKNEGSKNVEMQSLLDFIQGIS